MQISTNTLAIVLLLVAGWSCRSSHDSLRGNIIEIPLSGYIQTCTWRPSVAVKDDGQWREIHNPLPTGAAAAYYLDGKFVQVFMCDYVVCTRIKSPLQVSLVEYVQEEGTKQIPAGYGGFDRDMVPIYRSVPLTGEIRIEFEYYDDSTCSSQRLFSDVISR